MPVIYVLQSASFNFQDAGNKPVKLEQSKKGGSDGAQSDSPDEEEFTLKSSYLHIQDQVAYDSEVIPASKSAF